MPKKRWKDEFYVQTYDYIRSGYNEKETAKMLGVTFAGFSIWKKRYPALKKAIKKAKAIIKTNGKQTSFMDYVADHIPTELKTVWNKVQAIEDGNLGIDKINALLDKEGESVRQNIFLHALVSNNFKVNPALKKAGVSLRVLNQWKDDPDFPQLLEYIKFLRENFLEDALMMLVSGGDTTAIVAANQSMNAKRGYGKQIATTIDGNITTNNVSTYIHVENMNLSLATRKEILKETRRIKHEEEKALQQKQLEG